MLRKSKNINDLPVNQTPDRPFPILCNIPTELTNVFEFSPNRPVNSTDFRKLRSSLLVYPLMVYTLYKNSLGLHRGVVAVSVFWGVMTMWGYVGSSYLRARSPRGIHINFVKIPQLNK